MTELKIGVSEMHEPITELKAVAHWAKCLIAGMGSSGAVYSAYNPLVIALKEYDRTKSQNEDDCWGYDRNGDPIG